MSRGGPGRGDVFALYGACPLMDVQPEEGFPVLVVRGRPGALENLSNGDIVHATEHLRGVVPPLDSETPDCD